jgi:hypothetical protein
MGKGDRDHPFLTQEELDRPLPSSWAEFMAEFEETGPQEPPSWTEWLLLGALIVVALCAAEILGRLGLRLYLP